MRAPLTVECNLVPGGGRKKNSIPTTSRVPRISRLMALAIRFEDLIRAGGIADYSELAQLGHVSRARITRQQAHWGPVVFSPFEKSSR